DLAANEDTATGNLAAGLLGNDTDVDAGDTFTIVGVNATNTTGSVIFDEVTQTLAYDPNGQFESLAQGDTATDTFTYTIEDSQGAQSTATVTVTVTGANDAPVAGADDVVADEDAATGNLAAALLGNDSDVDAGDTFRIVGVDASSATGSVFFDEATQTLLYDPNGQFESLAQGDMAIDTFTYTIEDSQGAQSMATVTITVTAANDAPVAVDDGVSVAED